MVRRRVAGEPGRAPAPALALRLHRLDWAAALQREAARQARYGRPTTVLVIDLISPATGPSRPRPVRPPRLLDVLGREARETDRAMRAERARFMVLLPETGQHEAGASGDRIDRGYRCSRRTMRPVERAIRLEIAVLRRGADPFGAIADADRRLDGIADEELEDAS